MVKTRRDPSIGKHWLAHWALQGDEPIECVGDYLKDAQVQLGELIDRQRLRIGKEDEAFLSGLRLILIELSLAVDGKDGDFKLELKRRLAGKPINRAARARAGHEAAHIVEKCVAAGMKQEGAIAEAMAQTGVGRAEIFAWLKRDRRIQDRAAEHTKGSW